MDDRVMQFRIGMFVIVAGLVLTMMVVWFEAPTLIRQQSYITVLFPEAPGVDRGIPVRKSGVRVGEVHSFAFTPPELPEGVLVTLAIEPQYSLRIGTIPRLGRALIGDVSIDLIGGSGTDLMTTYLSPGEAANPDHWVEGRVAADPLLLLNNASPLIERADTTLEAIEAAAEGLSSVAGESGTLDEFLETWKKTGEQIDETAGELQRIVTENEEEIELALTSIRRVTSKMDLILDEASQEQLQELFDNTTSATRRLDNVLANLEPLAEDLNASPNEMPRSNLGQSLMRANRIAFEISALTSTLVDRQGQLNREGTLQRLVTDPQLFDDLVRLAASADQTVGEAYLALRYLTEFAKKISRNPSLIGEGVLNPR